MLGNCKRANCGYMRSMLNNLLQMQKRNTEGNNGGIISYPIEAVKWHHAGLNSLLKTGERMIFVNFYHAAPINNRKAYALWRLDIGF